MNEYASSALLIRLAPDPGFNFIEVDRRHSFLWDLDFCVH
jgi:hypothetical protein